MQLTHETSNGLPIEAVLKDAGSNVRWAERVLHAIRKVCTTPDRSSTYSSPAVTSGMFPLRGEFTFTRDIDGKKFTIKLKGSKWVCK